MGNQKKNRKLKLKIKVQQKKLLVKGKKPQSMIKLRIKRMISLQLWINRLIVLKFQKLEGNRVATVVKYQARKVL